MARPISPLVGAKITAKMDAASGADGRM